MLSGDQFIRQSFNNGLFYLRNIRDYCVNIQLSFYENNEFYSDRAESLSKRCEDLGRKIVDATEGRVPLEAIEYELFVTQFTLPCEELTEKLFGITLATDLTKEQMNLEGVSDFGNFPSTLLDTVQEINQEAYSLATEFIALASEIREKLVKNELFSYSYPSLYDYMIGNIETYQNTLERLQEKDLGDPIYVTNREFNGNRMLYAITLFLRGFLNTSETHYLQELNNLSASYATLLQDFQTLPLNPDHQVLLTRRSLALINQLRPLIQEMLQRLLDARLYFIVEPLLIDQFYTDVNFVFYQLMEIEHAQENF